MDLLHDYRTLAIILEKLVDNIATKKLNFLPEFKASVDDQIVELSILQMSLDSYGDNDDDDDDIVYELGVILRDVSRQRTRISDYEINKRRVSSDEEAKGDAYADPEIASLAEYTRGGLKTRNKFYKRK
jgi:hypothetical protein